MKHLLYFISISALFLLNNCRTPIDLESIGVEELLVVEAFISNLDHPKSINITVSTPINQGSINPVSNATIWITNKNNISHAFKMEYPGYYVAENEFDIISNEEYQLFITTSNGKNYASQPVIAKLAPLIDSVYAYYDAPYERVNIAVSTHDDTGESKYYGWLTEESFEIKTPFVSEWRINKYPINSSTYLVKNTEAAARCWKTFSSEKVLIDNTVKKNADVISNYPLRYIQKTEPDLRTQYSILVKQFSFDADYYDFLEQLKKLSENTGSLFDQQPGQLTGNIESLDDSKEAVLGYFYIGIGNEVRNFFRFDDFAGFPEPDYTHPCTLYSYGVPTEEFPPTPLDVLKGELSNGKLIFTSPDTIPSYETIYVNRECGDCSTFASTIRPSFWID